MAPVTGPAMERDTAQATGRATEPDMAQATGRATAQVTERVMEPGMARDMAVTPAALAVRS